VVNSAAASAAAILIFMVSSLVLLLSAHAREAGIQFFGSWVPRFRGDERAFIKLSANLF
jgi:hypothetical protein